MFISASYPSPLSIAHLGSMVPLQANNTTLWSRLRAVNMSVSNFVLSTKILPTKLTVPQHEAGACCADEDRVNDAQRDIGRCVSMPNIKQEVLQSANQSALSAHGDESLMCES